MATEIGLLSVTQLQNFPNLNNNNNHTQIGGSWMWNHTTTGRSNSEEDSWEVRAFAEDTNMGTTWPPRSYTCSFCRREFISAQALGGHMNVHRRDRVRPPPIIPSTPAYASYPWSITTSPPPLMFPTEEFLAAANNGGRLCVFYPLSTPCNLLSMSDQTTDMLVSPSTTSSPPTVRDTDRIGQSLALIYSHENEDGNSANQLKCNLNDHNMQFVEELDLELRLGWSR